jgi:hypothetical protein
MGRDGVALHGTRKVANRTIRCYEHAEKVTVRLLGDGQHEEEVAEEK